MNKQRKQLVENLPNVFIILKYMLAFGIVFVIFLSFLNLQKFSMRFFYGVGNAMLIAGAFYGAGGLTGFLFGIPKVIQSNHYTTEGSTQTSADSIDIIHNDNLVQISDWLTKIIVGVGLTQLYNIPDFLVSIGKQFGTSILDSAKIDSGTNASIAIVLYFSILGFMMVYIWTRLYFFHILKQTSLNFKSMYEEATEKLDTVLSEKKQIEEEKETTKTELDAIVTTFPEVTQTLKEKQIEMKQDKDIEDDPHKGKFGGMSERNFRKLSAKVKETSYDKELFVVDLEVISTDINNPITGKVTFYLHPSFPNEVETIPVIDGKAENKLISYGAFTVGAVCDEGTTSLELDLAQLPDVPQIFKER